jgi:hypothetical protein
MSMNMIRPRVHAAHSSQIPDFGRRARFRRSSVGITTWPAADALPASVYLRRWVSHQAETYKSLLMTIAAAPRPEVSVWAPGRRSPGIS